jgi:hypothetical protein
LQSSSEGAELYIQYIRLQEPWIGQHIQKAAQQNPEHLQPAQGRNNRLGSRKRKNRATSATRIVTQEEQQIRLSCKVTGDEK